MNIAIIHYHLKPGGVTNVIKHQVDSLSGLFNVCLLTGELPDAPICEHTILVPELGYTDSSTPFLDIEKLADTLSEILSSTFRGKCDLIHIHNPLLAKNRHFLTLLKLLQRKGYTLFLQIHDFAEDGRASAYYANESYLANCHYGVINSRDYNLLIQAGLKPAGLHLLPNTIEPISLERVTSTTQNRILYPVRAIRRKNIGEILLLSLFFKENIFSITLPPNSPSDMKSYNGWKEFSIHNNLDVEFESGLNKDFHTLIASSESIVSSSITEGFGFSFLEPWTSDKLFWGRSIPNICIDFQKKRHLS